MKNTSVLFKSLTVLFLVALLQGCASVLDVLKPTSTPPSQDNCSSCPPCQGSPSQDSRTEPSPPQESPSKNGNFGILSFWDKRKLEGLNLAFNSMGLGWKATIDQYTGSFKAAGQFQSLPIDILFNTGGGRIVEFAGMRVADIDIPLSKEGLMLALDDNIMRRLQDKGISEQTANTISAWLRPIFSVIRKAF